MVASRQVAIPYYRGVGRQRGRGLSALAQVIGRTAIPFLRKFVVPAAKSVGAVLTRWSLLHQRLEKLLAVESLSSRLQRVWETKLLKKQLDGGSRRGGSKQKGIIPTKFTKQSSRSRRDIFTNIFR